MAQMHSILFYIRGAGGLRRLNGGGGGKSRPRTARSVATITAGGLARAVGPRGGRLRRGEDRETCETGGATTTRSPSRWWPPWLPSILMKKDNWCDLTTPAAAPPLHAYQTRDHTLWHPLSLTDPLQEEKNISITSNSITTTSNNQCTKMESKEIANPRKKRKEKRISLKETSLLDNCMLQHASVTCPLQPRSTCSSLMQPHGVNGA